MTTLNTLDDYRVAIRHATNSHDLEALIYRALPALYADMKMPFDNASTVSVATKLYRADDKWRIWFNIEIPRAIAALTHLDPVIFQRMSGGAHQASSIVEGAYGKGFEQESKPFAMEPVFAQKVADHAQRLNQATSLTQWWATFFEVLPWSLAQTRGWTEPSPEQWAYAQGRAKSLETMYREKLQSYYLPEATYRDKQVHTKMNWSSLAKEFSGNIDRVFYPLLSHNPWLTLDSNSVHAIKVEKFNVDDLSKGLKGKAALIVAAHRELSQLNYMPAGLLRDALYGVESPAYVKSPENGKSPYPSPF